MRAEDLKEWLRGVEEEERARRKGKEGFDGAGDRWRLLVKLCEHIWRMGEIPQVDFFLTTPGPHTKWDTKSNFGYPNFWVTK